MKNEIDSEKLKEFFETMDRLDEYLTERISDLHNVQGGMQARHAYVFSRDMAWKAKYIIRDNMKEVKDKTNKVTTIGKGDTGGAV